MGQVRELGLPEKQQSLLNFEDEIDSATTIAQMKKILKDHVWKILLEHEKEIQELKSGK